MNATSLTPTRQKRWYAIDYAKAIAIILVVIGHFHPSDEPFWWTCVRQVIYSFHMPLFMFASGFLYLAASKKQNYGSFILNKVKRLMIPYFTTSVIIITIKLFSQGNAYVESPVTVHDYITMFYYPSAGYFLWFIWALWWMFLIVPLFHNKKARLILFTISVILSFIPWHAPYIFCFYKTQQMFVFFMLGVITYDQKDIFSRFVKLSPWVYVIAFVLAETVCLIFPNTYTYGYYILPYIGISATLITCRQITQGKSDRLKKNLFNIAKYSYGIYLFHTTFQGFAKAFVYKLPVTISPDGISFALMALLVSVCGIVFPILLYHYIINKNIITRFLFGIPSHKAKKIPRR